VNREVIRLGFGRVTAAYPFKLLDDFRRVEQEARTTARGLWAGATPTAPSPSSTESHTVYATRTGTKYHRDGCRSLSQSRIPMALKDAAARYGPCSICRPPILSNSAPALSTPSRPATQSASRQCAATTQRGTRCSRTASVGSSYCWQHGGGE
jgi:hypothetical protein